MKIALGLKAVVFLHIPVLLLYCMKIALGLKAVVFLHIPVLLLYCMKVTLGLNAAEKSFFFFRFLRFLGMSM
jgi:protein-arginine kinase